MAASNAFFVFAALPAASAASFSIHSPGNGRAEPASCHHEHLPRIDLDVEAFDMGLEAAGQAARKLHDSVTRRAAAKGREDGFVAPCGLLPISNGFSSFPKVTTTSLSLDQACGTNCPRLEAS